MLLRREFDLGTFLKYPTHKLRAIVPSIALSFPASPAIVSSSCHTLPRYCHLHPSSYCFHMGWTLACGVRRSLPRRRRAFCDGFISCPAAQTCCGVRVLSCTLFVEGCRHLHIEPGFGKMSFFPARSAYCQHILQCQNYTVAYSDNISMVTNRHKHRVRLPPSNFP